MPKSSSPIGSFKSIPLPNDEVDRDLREVREDMFALVSDLIDKGKELTQANIQAAGRIDTQYMLDAVNSRMDKAEATEVTGSFGWDQETFSNPERPGIFYAAYQELGTETIELMNALQDAGDDIFDEFEVKSARIFGGSN